MPADPTRRVIAAAELSWPDTPAMVDAVRRAAECWPQTFKRSSVDALEFALAAACAAGCRHAMAVFERRYLEPATAAVRIRGLQGDALAEVTQRVRVRLLVNLRDGAPVILAYAGGGRLGSLVRVVMIREAARLRSAPQPAELTFEAIEARGTDAPTVLRSRAQAATAKRAFERAARQLRPKDRSVLRLHYARQVPCPRIASMFGVHRVTAARWIESARINLLRRFSCELQRIAPELTRAQRERFDAWFQTNVELSLSRVLASAA
ncbi:MAG: hypothetical protein AAF721_06875 [Myxococcota bacterium]